MDEIIEYIKNNNEDNEKIKKLFYVILYNTIYKKFPFPNTIEILNILDKNTYNTNFIIQDNINYDKLMYLIRTNDNEILNGYFFLLNERNKKKKEIDQLLMMLNKYKFKVTDDITIDYLPLYMISIIKPYIESNFDDKFIYSIFNPLNDERWINIHRNEIFDRLERIMNLFNRNIIKMCHLKVKHMSLLYKIPFIELADYYDYCGKVIKFKITYIINYLETYEAMKNNLERLIIHNKDYIIDDNVCNRIIFDSI